MQGRATRRGRHLKVFLILLCLMLGLGVARMLGIAAPEGGARPVPATAASDVARPKPERRPAAVFKMPPIEDYAEVVERPLFSQTRRPVVEEAPVAAAPEAVRLVGILDAPGGKRALIEHGTPPRMTRVGEGRSVAGWKVEAIGRDRVVLTQGATRTEVKIRDRGPVPQGPGSARQTQTADKPNGTADRRAPSAGRQGQAPSPEAPR